MTNLNTCKDCTKRYPGCHDKCDSYKKFKDEIALIRSKRTMENEKYYMDKMARERCYKIAKKKRKL